MNINNCKFCGKDFETEDCFKSNCCDHCMKPKEIGFPEVHEKVFLKEYGYEHVSRIKEAQKRRILPYEKKGGGYYVGTFENGKIHEKNPKY